MLLNNYMKKILNIFVLNAIFLVSASSQSFQNYTGTDLLSFKEDSEWIRNNDIKTIYELHYLNSDKGELHMVIQYNYDSIGMLTSRYDSKPYKEWNIKEEFDYSFYRIYSYKYVDSMLIKTVDIYKRQDSGNIDTITKNVDYINVYNINSFKLSNQFELNYSFDSKGRCINVKRKLMIMNQVDILSTDFKYKNDLLIEFDQNGSGSMSKRFAKNVKYKYSKSGLLESLIVKGNPQIIEYKFKHDESDYIKIKKMYMGKSLKSTNEYIYVNNK